MTGLFIKIEGIENALSVEFYIERDNSIKIYKENLTKVFRGDQIEYYAYVDAGKLGRGHLMCRAEFLDRENAFTSRKVVVTGFTGYTIPCMGEGKSISCGGYEITFTRVNDIPKNDNTHIYIGSVKDWVLEYEYLTERMLSSLNMYDVKAMEIPAEAETGDRFVIAIPYDIDLKAYKDNGFGGKARFSTSVMGANGELLKEINGVKYNIYGEFITIGGKLKIYIE